MQQLNSSNGGVACGGGQRKRGRPRRYDTTLPLLPGAMEAQASAAMAGHINGVDSEKRKRTRGAKPKYHFVTAEEAIAHRRERNRITALASYEKRKAHENALRSQIAQLEQEQVALRELLDLVQQPVVDKGKLLTQLGRLSLVRGEYFQTPHLHQLENNCLLQGPPLLAKWIREGLRLADSAGASSRIEQRLGVLAAKLASLKDGRAIPDLDAAMQELQNEVLHLKSVEEEITGYAERALAETERLTKENEDLKKSQEDATLDRQMVKAMVEAEKLKAAGEAYKHDMLQTKVMELEAELEATRRAAKREASSMSRALSEARNAIAAREKEARALKLDLEQLRAAKISQESSTSGQANGSSERAVESAAPPEPSGTPLASEHEEIAVRLMAAGPSGVDQALLAAAAKALRDVSVLDKQLLRAREEKAKLAREVEDLNNTVFSKSFKAPSAWAEREVKYKMEKRDWDSQGIKLRDAIAKLEAENARYRAENKAAEFEAQIQELKTALSVKEAEKVEVQKELHELQIRSRDISGPVGLHLHDIDHDVVQNIIEDMEAHRIGVSAPINGTPSQSSRGSPSRSARGSPPRSSIPPLDLASHFVPGSNVEEIIQDYDEKGMGIAGPRSGRRSRRKGSRLAGDGTSPDVRADDSFDELRCGNVHDLQGNFLHVGQGPPDAHVAPSRAALEGDSLATPRGGLQHPAGFGSPLDPISGLLRGSHSEDGTPATAPLDALQHASRSGLPATGAVEGHTSASNVPASGADHSSAGSLPEQQARRSDQSLGEGVALGNGPSAADIDRLHGSPGRGVVENAFAVEPQDGDVGWASRSRAVTTDDCASEASSTLAGLIGRGTSSMGGLRDSSSDGGDEWDVERRAALKADRAAAEAAWGAHVADNDIGVLRWKAAEAGSRVELYEAQISKMQLALERADQENSRLEQELRALAESSAKGREERRGSSLAMLRDRVRSISLLSSPLEQQAAERLQDAGEKLKSSQHERAALQKQRDALARQLAHVAEKISSGMIPDTDELAVPEHIAAAAEASASVSEASSGDNPKSPGRPRFSGIGHVYAGLSDEEVEVMRLREENETLMETLVRAKVELAETQGDYLKTRRALLRSVEKQAHMAERLDCLKSAVNEGDLANASSLLTSSPSGKGRSSSGNTESLGERDAY
ncbi:hypothetical protein WJX75_001065 [Coccomyxa subellipsoidea]|uniref:BZIP domain-containing protein n=1 Tax=Coccomyxa subellipsoidea TaxID=248742 RepID=A0ABR2Z1N8_9CHLO